MLKSFDSPELVPGGLAMQRRPNAAIGYRPDIDGLRALAILPVVWFHSDLPGLPGGFTGVDTFFVISGYLITLIIHREVLGGSFSIARFYERRIRRIAPALLAVSAVSSVAALSLMLPYELVQFAEAQIAALGMASNIYFWKTGNYFALAEAVTPLLHTWSLGVEEQFYLIFPAALIIAERFKSAKRAVGVLLVASFLLCIVATARSPGAAFYLLPTRAWELMVGASLAVGLVSIPHRAKSVIAIGGVTLILASTLWISGEDAFPGWRAALPALGAAAIIGSGPDTATSRFLSSRALVYVGRISYSLYLWHWPVFVFLRHFRAEQQLPPMLAIAGIISAFGLAVLSYHFIEQPARDRSLSYRSILLASGTAAAGILLVAAVSISTAGLPRRLPKDSLRIAAAHDAHAPLARACTDIGFDNALKNCRMGPAGETRFLLWGDSHAAAASEGVTAALAEPGLVISMGSCAPAGSWVDPKLKGRDPATCRDVNAKALAYAQAHQQINTVVLSAYWRGHERAGGAIFWRGMQATVDQLRQAGKRVIVLAGIPDPGTDAPWAAAIDQRFGRAPLALDCPKARVPLHGVRVVDVSQDFCRGQPAWKLFTDSNHISRFAGLSIVAPELARSIANSSAGEL